MKVYVSAIRVSKLWKRVTERTTFSVPGPTPIQPSTVFAPIDVFKISWQGLDCDADWIVVAAHSGAALRYLPGLRKFTAAGDEGPTLQLKLSSGERYKLFDSFQWYVRLATQFVVGYALIDNLGPTSGPFSQHPFCSRGLRGNRALLG